jgi:threonine dehydrogenase-like Zn-dependent dehydrogenase
MKAIRFDAAIPRYVVGMAVRKIYAPLLWSGISCTFARDIPEPELIGEDWVKIKTRYGGICGTDLANIYLDTSMGYTPFSSFPFTFGHENTGTIVEVGSQAGAWQVGERVVINPTLSCQPRGFTDLCEFCARGEINLCQRFTEGPLPPGVMAGISIPGGGSWSSHYLGHTSQLYRVPDAVSDENAVLVEPFCIALHAVLRDFPEDEETILIIGAGTIGLLTLAALRVLGSKANILIAARYPFQVEAARKLGASQVLTDGDLFQQVAEQTGGVLHKPILGKRVMVGGADRTYETVGTDHGLDDAFRLTRTRGKVISEGMLGEARNIDWAAITQKELDVWASVGNSNGDFYKGEQKDCFQFTLDMMASGDLDLGWLVTHRYELDEYKRALKEASARGKNGVLKSVFEFEVFSNAI